MRKIFAILLSVCLYSQLVQAQITIAGNVYGGGNAGNLGKGTKVTVRGGDIHQVYGGARQANVGGSSFVHIDGQNSSMPYVVINKVYGGNDIAGTIGTSETLPSELTDTEENKIDNDFNAFVRLSTKTNESGEEEDGAAKVYIGQLFAGGNGDYYYINEDNKHKIYNSEQDYIDGKSPLSSNETDFVFPEIGKTYLEICGGSIVYAYGGGNSATITDTTVIFLNNPSNVVNSIKVPVAEAGKHPHANTSTGELLTPDRFLKDMGINTGFSKPSSAEFQIGRLFGGNNMAEMAIRPGWNLKAGKVRNIYSGGNKGQMTNPEGLLLEIRKDANVVIDNVFGGCRMADVHPMKNGVDVLSNDIQLHDLDEHGNPKYNFPAGLSARVIVRGGDINNVYGGNDITGRVYGGDAVGVYTSIRGDVYGGGNGSYPYTDNPKMIGHDIYGDLYYSIPDGMTSAEALKEFRPNAEQVSIRLVGDDADHPTVIGGAVYCGGNCATLKTYKQKPLVELKIGSHIIADNVFLGNNGANMIHFNEGSGGEEGVLRTMKRTDLTGDESRYNSLVLTDESDFSHFMDGVAMSLMPSVSFDADYEEYSSFIGSFFCGGNVGSMTSNGKTSITFADRIVVYNKVVGGCNNAFVTPEPGFNAIYEGGLTGDADENGDKLELNFDGLKIQPKRWNADHSALIWNTISSASGQEVDPVTEGATPENPVTSTDDDLDRRLQFGNIYGGCYNSGIVNGNVVININRTIIDRDKVFDEVEEDETGEDKLYGNDQYHITKRNSGVILSEQGMDVLGSALNVFGGGKGRNTEIWGSTTINLNRGYVFQIFGGSEEGGIGNGEYNETTGIIEYEYDPKYSTHINLHGSKAGVSKKEDMSEDIAECEFIYGGGFFGPVAGDCILNLGNGRIFNSFAGSCNADILGHTETYIGTNGFPFIRDFVYGGNDLGGKILNTTPKNFDDRLRNDVVRDKVSHDDMLNASAYIEYVQGRVEKIFGGAYGVYDYTAPHYGAYFYAKGGEGTIEEGEGKNIGKARPGYSKPFLDNVFINFRPTDSNNPLNTVGQIYGAGQGYLGEEEENLMQNRSYILIDVPQTMTTYQGTEIFGAGESGGVGMGVEKATADAPETAHMASAVIDLLSGHFKAVYGGSYQEGVTRRTEVNVPEGSTFRAEAIFGGAYGLYDEYQCDVFESNVNWSSSDALVGGYRSGIYGGNNNYRRTLYSNVNINAPVYYDKANEYYATVYGAGYGKDTWSQYTEVNLNNSARVYEVYGGGQLGRVMNTKSATAWATAAYATAHAAWEVDPEKASKPEPQPINLSLGSGYEDKGLNDTYAQYNYNTNVRINQGASVCGYIYNGSLSGAYAYGGGLGNANVPNTGDVHGTTFIGLFGGTVVKDLYAAGTVGSVNNRYNVSTDDFDNPFIASANAYIEGGKARNVYGGGWQGSVGYHNGTIDSSTDDDILGETNVIIGKLDGTSFINGLPAIERNAYGGGEGGAVFGTSHITLNNGFIGYRHFDSEPTTDTDLETIQKGSDYYQEKLHDETWSGDGTNRLYDSGCMFGGGYIDNSSVDFTEVKMYGGYVRNALFGGGEIAAIGRGVIELSGQDNSVRTLKGIYKAGNTSVELFDGEVHRNVFGGGRGYNNLGEGGTLFSDGYVFGQTEVHVHGGIVGTAKELALENGNVFGGGDIGYVYSAYEENGELFVGIKDGNRYDDKYEGYYYAYDLEHNYYVPSEFVYDEDDPRWVKEDGEFILTEDCKVLIEPSCKVLSPVTINGNDYEVGDFVPTSAMNTMGDKNADSRWNSLESKGVIIYNAVFAGGNTSSGSSAVYANTTTVFGNATASIHDVYHRDLITLGTGRNGGLYGDGNLTFVDGYRGLNITNYGTDYYTIQKEITINQYNSLPAREAAYYQLKYKCIKECTDKDGTNYHKEEGGSRASTLTIDDLLVLFEGVGDILLQNPTTLEWYPNPEYWEENGVCSIYAGRLMNTIQRADFCGVFGSRMVMQGAHDRVPEVVDHTNYTINRVREVSLNQIHSVISDDLALKPGKTPAASSEDQNPDDYVDVDRAIHGNYFGIYSIVNYLGALSSDVHFRPDVDIRRTNNSDTGTYGPTGDDDLTYYNWKKKHVNERKRNNGTSLNKVALASGVYLELTTEKSTGADLNEKDWGYVTGVIELDLINVQPGMGGGFVYAKNEHRESTYNKQKHVTLTALNADAITQKDFTYNGALVPWETSGNFVHGTQIIIDDCYNVSGKYQGDDAVPAHYWFIKGSVYVYDQYISAYTGAPNAYSESVDIPLTITAASHGTMKLLNVMPNKYAYYSSPGVPMGDDKKIVINDVTYYKNDPISYWDWYLLAKSEQALFVDETYVTIADCKMSSTSEEIIPAGTVLLPEDYEDLKNAHPTVYHVAQQKYVDSEFVYRPSNNLGHDTGYMLTYKVNNPTEWNTWYTPSQGEPSGKNQTGGSGYEDGPTYRLTSGFGGVFGQREYEVSNLISKAVYDTYQDMVTNPDHSGAIPGNQAEFEEAYIVTQEYANGDKHLHVGTAVSASDAESMTGYVAPALISTKTIQLSKTDFIYIGSRMTQDEKEAYKTSYPAVADIIDTEIVPAYYCKEGGLYGGDYYEPNKNYRGLAVWSSMSESDRAHFSFNYDALDLLIDPYYSKDPTTGIVRYAEGQKYQYDSSDATEDAAKNNKAGYSLPRAVDYSATYDGYETSTHNGVTLAHGNSYTREQFEKLPNEKRHYAPIDVTEAGDVYVVNTSFQIGNTPYAVGTVIPQATYNSLAQSEQENVTTLTFTSDHVGHSFYFCRENYVVGENTEGVAVTGVPVTGAASGTYGISSSVPVGLLIEEGTYNGLTNTQLNFVIHGVAPTETSTLFVSRQSDIFNLSKDRIITVVYQYDYEESDVSGTHITPISERHVVNIHVQFKSGIPTVEDIKAPQTVLPGTFVGIREPHVTPGAYEVTGGGWKLFEKEGEAESHINGIDYTPNFDPLYWYQDGFYLAYYAKTYLGETYSNHVKVSVANYHDLTKVMDDKEHHYYVDNEKVHRNSKIYITDGTNGAQQLKDFFNLSLLDESSPEVTDGVVTSGTLEGHAILNNHVKAGQDLEFFMHTNVTVPSGSPAWTPIGDDTNCFAGNFHGDGYHIDGLDNSLFGTLCGSVYNLGVTGTFTSAGIADKGNGYVENCWIYTTAESGFDPDVKAVFGNPSSPSSKQTVNCYYPETKNYKAGDANPISEIAFYNGTVAYNLNGFYLYKRYNDQKTNSGIEYKFYTKNDDGTLSEPQTKHYASNPAYCSSGFEGAYANGGYVEDRYADGDFRYADGAVPENEDPRILIDAEGKSHFYPVWPDDYIYFGQMLTYKWNDQRAHEDVPSRIVKSSGHLSSTDESNRVYRAPAYYQSKTMGVAHFNPAVNLVAYSKPESINDTDLHPAYPNMTAIDFAGHNDTEYKLGRNGQWFYQPLLDESGIIRVTNRDETPNLLVYAPSEAANKQTFDVLTGYFVEPDYTDYYNPSDNYRRVAVAPTWTVFGHLVQSDFTAISDHLLVDKKDFNCPMSYTFEDGKRMWYQRVPDTYVSPTKGWSTVSLPFLVELVSTQDKGEITHFYAGSKSIDQNGTKIGHEYWLREYKGKISETDEIYKASFGYPTTAGEEKTVNNTFLWDYYYSKNAQLDSNTDTYQTYYQEGRTYEDYPLLTAAQPYIVGFPGKSYYEFDLSGDWKPVHTAPTAPAKLDIQTISFIGKPGVTVGVSDDELIATDADGYSFVPNYMSKTIEGYLMNTDGDSFDKTPDGGLASVPFRPYFTKIQTSGTKRFNIRSIVFDSSDTTFAFEDNDEDGEMKDEVGEGTLLFTVRNRMITVESSLRHEADVRIVNASGVPVDVFNIQPGATVSTDMLTSGVYIIRAAGGKYQKKLIVK